MNVIKVGPLLRKKQQEWAELYSIVDIDIREPPQSHLCQSARHTLAGLYFDDGAKGRETSFPETDNQVLCYRITRSRFVLLFYSMVCLLHMSLPFFERPYCPWSSQMSGNVDYHSTDLGTYSINRTTSNSIQFCCLAFYIVELAVRESVGRPLSGDSMRNKWVWIRLGCCIALTVDGMLSFMNVRFGLCLVPIIYISRRNSLRQIVEGVLLSSYRCIPVFTLLFALVVLWSFVGFLIFRNLEMDNGSKFGSLWRSFLTCLQTHSSRGYAPFVLTPYYDKNPLAALFFVGLTVVTDILCTAFIIAIGNREYKLYSVSVFAQQLRNRKQAIVALHRILLEDEAGRNPPPSAHRAVGTISRHAWINFGTRIRGRHMYKRKVLHMMFNTECDPTSDTITCLGLFRLCALLDARLEVRVASDDGGEDEEGWDEERHGHDNGGECVSGINEVVDLGTLWKYLWGRAASRSDHSESSEDYSHGKANMDALRPLAVSSAGRTSSGSSLTGRTRTRSRDRGRRGSLRETHLMTQQALQQQVPTDATAATVTTAVRQDSDKLSESTQTSTRSWALLDGVRRHFSYIRLAAREVVACKICFRRPGREASCEINAFNACTVACRFLLVAQLLFYSDPEAPRVWTTVGWVLEFFFWVEMFLLLAALGWRRYWQSHGYGSAIIVNVVTLVLMVLLGGNLTDRESTHATYLVLTLLQCTRLLGAIGYTTDAGLFNSLIPLILRVLFIIFCVIYFFGVFAYNRFCNALRLEEAVGNDDFSFNWIPYRSLLNFDTFAQTLFTLFEISILGTWSSTMNVAAKVDAPSSLLFFYSFRLVMAVAVYPLTTAFIIQAFMSRQGHTKKLEEGQDSDSPREDCHDGDEKDRGSTIELRMLPDGERGGAWSKSYSSKQAALRRRTVTIGE